MVRMPVRNMHVRPARIEEAARLAELSGQLGYPAEAAAMALRLARILASPEHCVLVAVGEGDRVTGWIHAVEQTPLEYGARCELLGLVVDQGQRGLGVGRALVSAAEKWAHARDLREVAVRSNAARSESHPFYERLGYQRVKTQHVYRKPLP